MSWAAIVIPACLTLGLAVVGAAWHLGSRITSLRVEIERLRTEMAHMSTETAHARAADIARALADHVTTYHTGR